MENFSYLTFGEGSQGLLMEVEAFSLILVDGWLQLWGAVMFSLAFVVFGPILLVPTGILVCQYLCEGARGYY